MWIWILISALALVLIALIILVARFFYKNIYEKPERGHIEPCEWIKERAGEEIYIESFDGLRLCGYCVCPKMTMIKGTVIAFHGYHSQPAGDHEPMLDYLFRQGYRLIIPYQRAHGKSEGKFVTYGVRERKDCVKWAQYARERFGDTEPLFLAGMSMGSTTVLMASGLSLPENIRGLIADCGFTSPWDIMAHVGKKYFHIPAFPFLNLFDIATRMFAGFGLKEADTREALKKNRLPVIFYHGEEDDFVPVWMTRENFKAASEPKSMYIAPGAAHVESFIKQPEESERRLKEFLEKYGGEN